MKFDEFIAAIENEFKEVTGIFRKNQILKIPPLLYTIGVN